MERGDTFPDKAVGVLLEKMGWRYFHSRLRTPEIRDLQESLKYS